MIHYSCDRCKCVIDAENDLRYIVKMEVYASCDPLDGAEDEGDRDHLLEIHEILERAEDASSELISDEVYHARRYDLCSDCYKKFVNAPLGRETVNQPDFSHN